MDLNPKNIMFSPTRNKIVFIDFGLSEIIEENCGFKTFTNFIGTPKYTSKEMRQLLAVDSLGDYVDLYYNDLVGLQTTIKELTVFYSEAEKKKRLNFDLQVP